MISTTRGLAALSLLFIVVIGNRFRRSELVVHVNPDALSEKSTSLVPDVNLDIESKPKTTDSSEDHTYVWKQELLVTRIAICSGLICIPLVFGIQNWTQWIIGTCA